MLDCELVITINGGNVLGISSLGVIIFMDGVIIMEVIITIHLHRGCPHHASIMIFTTWQTSLCSLRLKEQEPVFESKPG